MIKKILVFVFSVLLVSMYCYPAFAADPVKLTWLVPSKSKYLVQAEQGLIDSYQKEHPNVQIELKTSTWATYNTTLLPLISSGNIPDLMFHVETKPWSLYSMLGKDSILPVDDLMAEFKDDLPPNAVENSFWDGHYRALPFALGPVVLFYRQDLFDAANIKPPKNWDDLLAAAKALSKDSNGDGKIDIFGYTPNGKIDFQTVYESHCFMLGNNGGYLDKNAKVDLNTPANIEAITFFLKLFDKAIAPPGAVNYGYGDSQRAFISGKTAMVCSYGYLLRRVMDDNPSIVQHVRAIPMPRKAPGMSRLSSGGRNSMYIYGKTKHPKAARDFLRFLMSQEGQLAITQAYPGGNLPSRNSIRESKEYMGNKVLTAFPQATQALINEAPYCTRPGTEYGQNPGAGELSSKYVMGEAIQKINIDHWDVEKALNWAEAEIKEMFQQ